jgi:hypothetical protein
VYLDFDFDAIQPVSNVVRRKRKRERRKRWEGIKYRRDIMSQVGM